MSLREWRLVHPLAASRIDMAGWPDPRSRKRW